MSTGTSASPATPTWVAGLDVACAAVPEADHVALRLARALVGAGVPAEHLVVATHLVPAPGGFSSHIALSVTVDGPPAADAPTWQDVALATCVDESFAAAPDEVGLCVDGNRAGLPGLAAGAAHAADEARTRRGGRAVAFPGSGRIGAQPTVGELLGDSAIDEVVVLGAEAPATTTVLETRDHVRPRWRDGRLVLDAQPSRGGRLVPFENPHPTPCCADH